MNKKYFSTDMSSAPRCIHDYIAPEMQVHAMKVATYYDKKLKGMEKKVSSPSYEKDSSVVELKRIAPDHNARTGFRMVNNAVSAELMHIPVTQQIHSTIDIGGVAKHMHDVQMQPPSTSAPANMPANSKASNTNGIKTNTTSAALNDMAKKAGETYTKRVNKIASSFVDITGLDKAKKILNNVGKNDFIGQLEAYVGFVRTMTAEWLMLATSTDSGSMDKTLFCCLLKNIKGGDVDPSKIIQALAKLKAFLNLSANILNVYNSFLGLVNRLIKAIVMSASAMLSDLFSKFYYMLVIPYVAEAENMISGKKIIADGLLEQAKKDMNLAMKVHQQLEKHFKNTHASDMLKDCNLNSAILGGIPLSLSDDLLRQMVKMLKFSVGEIGEQINLTQLQTMNDLIDSLIYTLDNMIKLGALSSNGAFCKNAKVPQVQGSQAQSGGNNNDNGYLGSKPGTYDTTPDYGQPLAEGKNSDDGSDNGSTVPEASMTTMQSAIQKLLNNTGFFDKRFGYSSKRLPDGGMQNTGSTLNGTQNTGSTLENAQAAYVTSLTNETKRALARHLADQLSNLFGILVSPDATYAFIDARFSNGTSASQISDDESDSPMAAYAKDVDSYVRKLS